MIEAKSLLNNIEGQLKELNDKLFYVESELNDYDTKTESIVVKKINAKKYYYKQWRELNRIRTKLIGPVNPGSASQEERKMINKKKLIDQKKELSFLIDRLEKQKKELRDYIFENELNVDYDFEVYWKDQLTARISVKNDRVHVSRYTDHPLRQIFPSEVINRNQLNEILKLRCLEEGRDDIYEKLKALGLSSYDPLKIIKKTHGVSFNDYIWIRFPGEDISMKDVMVRK